ncbi:Hsp20/alpha crystallin family protein [Geomonas sp. Red32]|uniref:Hsp20/alpha crystallin family protein n=1 Tax=Geomonas sp. Red32 TaxID=2912856 RepID=UPI00202CC095|nr:Hsp20/alpha crystallin family protein [Geomonas sp. Red32]MCM0083780.1 Hsp20/alpha crystallin family protein [Geomonas sp. Red32]
MTTRDVTTSQEKNLQGREETRAPERFLRPAVNIVEEESGLLVTADLPGASKENLDIRVEKGVLTITAPVHRQVPGRPVYSEFSWAPYYRQFQIPDSIDQNGVNAEFNNGVLSLRLPKAAAAKPRRIEISVQ